MIFKKKADWDNLEDCLKFSWRMLKKGADNFRHPFHFPAFVTSQNDNAYARTVILRGFSETDRILTFHSDLRSAKIDQIMTNPKVAWLFYDPKTAFQLRISGVAVLHIDDDKADKEWKKVRVTGRMNYCTTQAPGTELEAPSSGLPAFFSDKVLPALDKNSGRENFAAITCCIDLMDWLVLGAAGHRRARFLWNKDDLKATWIIP